MAASPRPLGDLARGRDSKHFGRDEIDRSEIGAVLDTATAHGWLDAPPLATERDRLGGMIYSLARR